MIVRDVMTANPAVAQVQTSIADALEMLSSLDIRHLPVVSDGELVGMVSDRDLRALALSRVVDFEGLGRAQTEMREPVSRIMSGDVVSVGPEDDLVEAIDAMLDAKVGAVPVVDEDTGDLQGIVSYVDVLRALRDSV